MFTYILYCNVILCHYAGNPDKNFEQLSKKEREETLESIKTYALNTMSEPLEQVGLKASSINFSGINSNKKVYSCILLVLT